MLKAGAQIPDDPELEVDLTGPQYGYSNKSQIQLEKKEDMKARGLASPDLGGHSGNDVSHQCEREATRAEGMVRGTESLSLQERQLSRCVDGMRT